MRSTLLRAVTLMLLVSSAAAQEVLRDALRPDDPTLPSGEHVHTFERAFAAGFPVVLALTSTDFDVYLAVLDPSGEVVLDVDDTPGFGLDVRETLVPEVSGTYLLVVTSAFPGETGAYELSIDLGASNRVDPTAPSGTVGPLDLGSRATGRLAGSAGTTYHTYVVEVPSGTSSITFDLQADADLDLFVKHGSDIVDWGDAGDWYRRDIDVAPFATITVAQPLPGTWYVDVVFPSGSGVVASYALEVR